MLRWFGANFMLGAPHKIGGGRTDTTEIWAGVIDGWNFKAFGVGLLLTANRNVHPVFFTILVRIKFSFDPKIVFDPIGGGCEAGNYLGEAVLEGRNRFFSGGGGFRLDHRGLSKTKAWANEASN